MAGKSDSAQGEVWGLALATYNREHTKKHPIDPDAAASKPSADHFCSLEALLHTAKSTCDDLYGVEKRTGRGQALSNVIQGVRLYAPVLDVFTQGQPCAVSACWGMVRLILEFTGRGLLFGEELLCTIGRILRRLSTFKQQVEYLVAKQEDLSSVAKLYAYLIEYLSRASRYCAKSKLKRYAVAISPKLKEIAANMWRLAAEVQAQFDTRCQTSHHEFMQRQTQAWQASCTRLKAESNAQKYRHEELLMSSERSAAMQRTILTCMGEQSGEQADRKNLAWLLRDLEPAAAPRRPECGTCTWFATHPTLIDWRVSDCSTPLLITGPSGCGKTFLAAAAASSAVQACESVVHTSVVQASGTYSDTNSRLLLSILAKLMENERLTQSPTYPKVRELLERCRTNSSSQTAAIPIDTLFELLREIARLAPPLLLIVDGIDLLKHNEPRQDRDQAARTLSLLCDIAEYSTVSVILFACPRRWISEKADMAMRLEITPDLTNADIAIYVREWLQKNPKCSRDTESLTTKVLAKSNGDFLYADLLLEALKTASTPGDFVGMLEEAPHDVDDLYVALAKKKESELTFRDQQRRKKILYMATACPALTIDSVDHALALDMSKDYKDDDQKLWHPKEKILELCEPWMTVDSDLVRFRHSSARRLVLSRKIVTESDANAFMLMICLTELVRATFTTLAYISRRLTDNLLVRTVDVSRFSTGGEAGLYRHAALHWHEYALATRSSLPAEHWEKLRAFLHGNAFVSWSENIFIFTDRNGLDRQLDVEIRIADWYGGLPDPDKPDLNLATYFIQPYQSVSQQLSGNSEPPVLQYLALMRPAHYLNLGGRTEEDFMLALQLKETVVNGLTEHLGPTDRNTLLARRSYYQELSGFDRYDEALEGYLDILRIQREDLDQYYEDTFDTLQWIGFTEYTLARLGDAQKHLREAREGFETISGENSKRVLVIDLFLGYAVEADGRLEEAATIYVGIKEKWIPINGSSTGFSTGILAAYGSLLRKQGDLQRALEFVLESFGACLRVFGGTARNTVDAGLHVAAVYRQSRNRVESAKFLHQIRDSVIIEQSYERKCQLAHLDALLAFDGGEYEGPRDTLSQFVANSIGENRGKNNVEVLWMRLDLADARKAHNDDLDTIPFLFTELVVSSEATGIVSRRGSASSWSAVSHTSAEVIVDDPRELNVAEQALRYVRNTEFQEAANLLAANKLRWARQKDFWNISGGPKVDLGMVRYDLPRLDFDSEEPACG